MEVWWGPILKGDITNSYGGRRCDDLLYPIPFPMRDWSNSGDITNSFAGQEFGSYLYQIPFLYMGKSGRGLIEGDIKICFAYATGRCDGYLCQYYSYAGGLVKYVVSEV